LAKATQNPVTDLISVPLQNNLDYDIGPFHRARYTLNIQPVIPISLSGDWNLITRTILPVVWQPNTAAALGGTWGLGDLNPTQSAPPARPGALSWGAGLAFSLPTATQTNTGTGKWSIGPSVVVLTQPGHWTIGALASNVWSFAGNDDRPEVDVLTL